MEEKEIDKILNPKRKLIILLVIYLSIAFVFIGLVFLARFRNKKEAVNISEVVLSDGQNAGKCVKVEIDTLPILLTPISKKETQFYYIKDVNNRGYVVNLSNETFKNISGTINTETGKLETIYQLEGILNNMDDEIKKFVLSNVEKVFEESELNSENFSEYLGTFYIKENSVSRRMITLYTCSALFGVFFLILALGYLLPGILKANKRLKNQELMEELRTELQNLTDTPYKKQHVYLTRNYIVFGVQAMKYDEIAWGYIEEEKKYEMTVGKNLIVHDQDDKKYMIASVSGNKNNILDDILVDISSRNANIKIGCLEENTESFEK